MAQVEENVFNKVLILGHSFARRHAEFVHTDKVARLDFGFHGCSTQIHGVGGWKIKDVVNFVNYRQPDPEEIQACILLIGENDIDRSTDPEGLCYQLLAAASHVMHKLRAKILVLAPLFPRFQTRACSVQQYNEVANAVNKQLGKEIVEGGRILMLCPPFAFNAYGTERFHNMMRFFRLDGVHLNNKGHCLLYKAMQKTLLHNRRLVH